MLEYIIKPIRRCFEKDDGCFSVYIVREHPERGKLGGWAAGQVRYSATVGQAI